MESTINVISKVGGNGIPDIVHSVCEDIISQWEVVSGMSSKFTLRDDAGIFRVQETTMIEGEISPSFTLNDKGYLTYYTNTGWILDMGDLTDPGWTKKRSEECGVGDIFSLKPHEKGLLKLKYNTYGTWLFFPTQLLAMVKGHQGLYEK